MKKLLVLMMTLVLAFALTACGDGASTTAPTGTSTEATTTAAQDMTKQEAGTSYEDGIYFSVAPAFHPETGWKGTVIVEVSGGKITKVDWNAVHVNAGKDKKTSSKDGEYNMVKFGKAQAEWHEQAERVEQFVLDNGGIFKVDYKDEKGHTDSIAGVSIHVNDFEELFNEAMAQGPVGTGKYKDGHYHAEMADFNGDWKDSVNLTVVNGYICAVNWTGVNKDGVDKKQHSLDGNYKMVEYGKAQSEWHEQVALAEDFLLNEQDIALFAPNAEGRTDVVAGISIKVTPFVELVKQALGQ